MGKRAGAASARGRKRRWRRAGAKPSSGFGRGADAFRLNRMMLSMRGAPAAGRAQSALMAECVARQPNAKRVFRAWREGARFEHEPRQAWPGMFLSSVGGAASPLTGHAHAAGLEGADAKGGKAWLWEAMARQGADLGQMGSRGLGFEHLAVEAGDERALMWWKGKGMGIGRRTRDGRSVWSLAFERSPPMVAAMAREWPEEAAAERVSEELYGLGEAMDGQEALRKAEKSMGAVAGFHMLATRSVGLSGFAPGLHAALVLAPSMRRWPQALRAWPELVRPNGELSAFMRRRGAAADAVGEVEALERSAMARFERDELSREAAAAPRARRREAL